MITIHLGRQEEDDRQGQLGFNEGILIITISSLLTCHNNIGLSKGFKHGNLCGNLYSHCILKINEKLMRTDANNDNEVSNTINNKAKLEISKAILYHLIFELIPGTISFFIKKFSLLIILL